VDSLVDAEPALPLTQADETVGRAPIGGLARGGALNFAGAVVSAFTNLLLAVAVTRGLSTDQAGVFFSVTSFFLVLVGAARLGSGTALTYFVARLVAVDQRGLVQACLRIALLPVAVFSVLLALALLVAADPLARLIVDGDTRTAVTAIRVSAVFLPFAALLEGVLGASRGFGGMRPTVVIEKVLRPIVQLLLVLLLATAGTAAVVTAWSFPYVPAVVAGGAWLLVLQRRSGRGNAAHVDSVFHAEDMRRSYWRFTGPRAVSGLIQVALQRLDVVIVAAILGAGPSALYVVSTRLLVLGAFGIQAIAMAIQPQVASHHVRGDAAAVRQLYRTATTWLILMTWPLYLVGIVFAPTALQVFGPGYAAGRWVLVILAGATLLSTACGVVDVMLNMAGKSSWILGNVSLALAVNVVLNLTLVPVFGIEGAAWAWAAAIVINNVLPLTQLFASARIHPFGRSLLVACAATIGSYIPVSLAARLLVGQTVTALVIGVVAGSTIYLAVLWSARRTLSLDEFVRALRRGRRRTSPAQR